jgi:hypothetical protein
MIEEKTKACQRFSGGASGPAAAEGRCDRPAVLARRLACGRLANVTAAARLARADAEAALEWRTPKLIHL